jgi:hypothetical protein
MPILRALIALRESYCHYDHGYCDSSTLLVGTTCPNQPPAPPNLLIRLAPLLVNLQKPTLNCASSARSTRSDRHPGRRAGRPHVQNGPFPPWLGLTPRQFGTGGKRRSGHIAGAIAIRLGPLIKRLRPGDGIGRCSRLAPTAVCAATLRFNLAGRLRDDP